VLLGNQSRIGILIRFDANFAAINAMRFAQKESLRRSAAGEAACDSDATSQNRIKVDSISSCRQQL